MKSKFMKSMQLLWQSSPVTNEEDEVLQEKESARQDCSIDPALAKEYVRALTEEQIPQPLLDKMADLINESRSALKLCGTKSGKEIDKAKAAGITPFEPSRGCVAFKEARLIFKCRKLYCDQLRENSFIDKSILETWYPSRDLHKIFIGEIEEVWEE